MLNPLNLQLSKRCMTTLLIVSALFVAPAFADMGGSAGGGGDVVYCKSTDEYRLLDAVSVEPIQQNPATQNKSTNEILQKISSQLTRHNTLLGFSFNEFYRTFLKDSAFRTWESSLHKKRIELTKINDEFFVYNNSFCPKKDYEFFQVFARFENEPINYIFKDTSFDQIVWSANAYPFPSSGSIVYYFDKELVENLRATHSLDFVMLIIHEWLRDFTSDSRVIQEITRYLVSQDFLENLGRKEFRKLVTSALPDMSVLHLELRKGDLNKQQLLKNASKHLYETIERAIGSKSLEISMLDRAKLYFLKNNIEESGIKPFKDFEPSEDLLLDLKALREKHKNDMYGKIFVEFSNMFLKKKKFISSLERLAEVTAFINSNFYRGHFVRSRSISHGGSYATALNQLIETLENKNTTFLYSLNFEESVFKLNAMANFRFPDLVDRCDIWASNLDHYIQVSREREQITSRSNYIERINRTSWVYLANEAKNSSRDQKTLIDIVISSKKIPLFLFEDMLPKSTKDYPRYCGNARL